MLFLYSYYYYYYYLDLGIIAIKMFEIYKIKLCILFHNFTKQMFILAIIFYKKYTSAKSFKPLLFYILNEHVYGIP